MQDFSFWVLTNLLQSYILKEIEKQRTYTMKTFRVEINSIVDGIIREVLEVKVSAQSNQDTMKALYERVYSWCVNMGVCPDDYDYDYELVN